MRAEVIENETPQLLTARSGDVNEIVIGTGDEVHVQHLTHGGELLGELPQMPPRTSLHTNRDHRLQAPAEGSRIDIGMEAPDHPTIDQRTHTTQTGRRSDTRQSSQGIVRDTRIPNKADRKRTRSTSSIRTPARTPSAPEPTEHGPPSTFFFTGSAQRIFFSPLGYLAPHAHN